MAEFHEVARVDPVKVTKKSRSSTSTAVGRFMPTYWALTVTQ